MQNLHRNTSSSSILVLLLEQVRTLGRAKARLGRRHQGTYLKLIPKPQGAKGDDQQALDVMKQKYKARGEEVEIKAVIGDAILLETTLQKQLNSCLRKSPSPERKRDKLRFHFPQESDDEQ